MFPASTLLPTFSKRTDQNTVGREIERQSMIRPDQAAVVPICRCWRKLYPRGSVRDRDHVRSVAQHPCLVCGRRPADAHHLRFAQSKALGRKVSDEFTVPLCRGHHRDVHRCGDEGTWWRNAGVDPTVAARLFWLESHPLQVGQEEPTSNNRSGPAPRSPPPTNL